MSALDELLKFDTNALRYDEFIDVLKRTDVNAEKDVKQLKKAFQTTKNTALNIYDEYKATLDLYKEDNERSARREQEFKDEMDYVQNQLNKYQQDPNYNKIDNEVRLEELEVQNRDLKSDLAEMRYKFEKLRTRNDEIERQIKNYRDEALRLKDQLRDYENRNLDEKLRTEQGRNNEKIRNLNRGINELRAENEKIYDENQRLNQIIERNKNQLKDTTFDMDNIRRKMDNLNELKIKKDLEIKELAENNYSLKFQVDQLTSQIMSFQNQEAQLSDARNQVINFKSMLQEKEREIERLKSGDNFQRIKNHSK